ncbi:small protein A (tmRNA-binding) [secondary endosymbiont of Heteropsylla cubana]|uniref:Outer membrane protein assembly factor BamE n=2 Tax=secondary endosymbiont of Heteropsylla cubana TaxID=134287 RepID=J3Z5S0_9ENTR|nr:small protein A (tmRNA-binding) [secondary endosymbiont of Heteropsylla cubana]
MTDKKIISTVFVVILISGCSMFKNIIYHPDINQGNYLILSNVSRVRIGMTKQQVVYILGRTIMHDPFDSNTWYYIFRRASGYKNISQETLILTFNDHDVLIDINYRTAFKKSKNLG